MSRRPDSLRSIHALSLLCTVAVFLAVGLFAGPTALLTVLVLSALEITFSFDNAVVNAKVLRKMPLFWQRMFLTVGVLIAVFGMRLVLPILLVSLTSGLAFGSVLTLALEQPERYAQHLTEAHPVIASFGGIFLLMIFLEFLLDYGRRVHWLRLVEQPLRRVGRLRQFPPLLALLVLVTATELLAGEHKFAVLISGVAGLIVYLALRSLAEVFELQQQRRVDRALPTTQRALMQAGFVNFIYLEILDASFSFDGVIGAFAITNMVILIAAGLGVGAVWVRSLTIHIVRKDTLAKYRYLDHGAHYAIGALAVMLLLGIRYDIPEAVTGSIGIVIIALALASSWQYNRNHRPVKA